MKEKIKNNIIDKKLYDGLSQLFYKLGVNGNDVTTDFIYSYLEYAFTQSNIKNDIYTSTGFGVKQINTYLKKVESKKNPSEETNTIKETKSSYETLIGLLETFANNSNNGVIPIYGKYESFNSAFNIIRKPANNISAKSMLNKFIRIGVLEQVDTKHVKFLTTLPTKGFNEPENVVRILSDAINRLCHTILHNMNVKENDDGLTQSSYWSNSINPKHYDICRDQLRDEVRTCMKSCSMIIDKFEKKGLSKEEAEIQNVEFGVSAFIFKNSK